MQLLYTLLLSTIIHYDSIVCNSDNNNTITIIRDNYHYWCYGNCDTPKQTISHPGIILMGGGMDVDEAFKQQIKWSDCGDFLVLRSNGGDGYNKHIYDLGCSNSVSTLLINNKEGANDEFVINKINTISALFIAAGDQTKYLLDWTNTLLQDAINNAINDRNVSIGGISAGAMIQSWYIFNKINGTVYSEEALRNPYNGHMQFNTFFIIQKLSILYNTIIDTHFENRDRFGRLISFIARLRQDHDYPNIKGIGINDQTAFAIDLETGIGVTMGPLPYGSAVFVLMPGINNNPLICEPNTPLTYNDVIIQKLEGLYSDTFNVITWEGGDPNSLYPISVVDGKINRIDPYDPPFNKYN